MAARCGRAYPPAAPQLAAAVVTVGTVLVFVHSVLVVDAAPDTAELVELAADQFDWFMVRRAFAVLPGRG